MKCPKCHKPAEVLETRKHAEGVRRRYQCFNNHRFTTLEKVVILRPGRKAA